MSVSQMNFLMSNLLNRHKSRSECETFFGWGQWLTTQDNKTSKFLFTLFDSFFFWAVAL